MREIKFRAWDNYLKKMVFEGFHIWGEVTEFDLIKMHCYENPNPAYKSSLLRANDMIFTQYTGLKDKNGKEIYEDDVIKSDSHINPDVFQIKFIEGGFCATNPIIKNYPIDINHFYPSVGCCIEIIGNIYENENLIKGE